jgi:hypothetical protein
MQRRVVLITPIIVAFLALLMIGLAVYNSWLGPMKSGIMMFCEQARAGFIKQPSNTFSNIGFIVMGFYIAWLAYKNNFSTENRMTSTLFYPAYFASIVVFLGPGSMALHATNTYWGGFIDLFSMFLFSSFVSSYAIMRWFSLSEVRFVILYTVSLAICSLAYLSPYNTLMPLVDLSNYCFGLQLIIGTIFELRLRYERGHKIKAGWGWLCLFTFLLAFYIWNLSRTQDSPFCNPESLIQGHAIWHLLNALATYFLYLFYTSEEDRNHAQPMI